MRINGYRRYEKKKKGDVYGQDFTHLPGQSLQQALLLFHTDSFLNTEALINDSSVISSPISSALISFS